MRQQTCFCRMHAASCLEIVCQARQFEHSYLNCNSNFCIVTLFPRGDLGYGGGGIHNLQASVMRPLRPRRPAELSSSKMIGLHTACRWNQPVWSMRVGFYENCELTICRRPEGRPGEDGGPEGGWAWPPSDSRHDLPLVLPDCGTKHVGHAVCRACMSYFGDMIH